MKTFMKNILRQPCVLAVLLTAFCNFTSFAQINLTNGLIDYYPFNGNANDVAGANNGTSFGATLTANRFGAPNAAYLFNGYSSYIATAHPMQDLTNATFSLWFDASSAVDHQTLLSDSDTAPGNDCNIQFWNVNEIGVVASKQGGGPGYAITNGVGNFQESIAQDWLQFVWVMQPTNQQIFVNGLLVASVYATANDVGYHGGSFVIGASSSDYPYDNFFNGAISNVRIYNRALSTNEIAALYQYESTTPQFLTASLALQVNSTNLVIGGNYQIQTSSNLVNWVNYGTPFIATSTNGPLYIPVANPQAYFRILTAL